MFVSFYMKLMERSNLKDTLTEIEQLRLKMKAWPPVTGRNEKTPRQTLTQVLDDELGYD